MRGVAASALSRVGALEAPAYQPGQGVLCVPAIPVGAAAIAAWERLTMIYQALLMQPCDAFGASPPPAELWAQAHRLAGVVPSGEDK